MATKAEWFRYWKERSGAKEEKRAPRPRTRASAASRNGASPADGRHPAARESAAAGKKAAYALEDSSARPSRKSTRKASNRQKTDTKMRVLRRTARSRPRS